MARDILKNSLYQRILGHPFVYKHIRPLAVGGIDYTDLFKELEVVHSDRILDVGCGTGDTLRYLKEFQAYLGLDIDETALNYARMTYPGKNIEFSRQNMDETLMQTFRPTVVVLGGILHHLTDQECLNILGLVMKSESVKKTLTYDCVFLPGEPINNFFAYLDRGRYCRTKIGYQHLVQQAGLKLSNEKVAPYAKGAIAKYFAMTLVPNRH